MNLNLAHPVINEEIESIETRTDGTTVVVTTSNVRITLSKQAAVQLLDHLLNSQHLIRGGR